MVEIKVDLKRNSKDDIRKVIDFLQKFVDEDSVDSADISPGAFNLFSNPASSAPTTDEDPDDDEDDTPDESDLEIKPIFY